MKLLLGFIALSFILHFMSGIILYEFGPRPKLFIHDPIVEIDLFPTQEKQRQIVRQTEPPNLITDPTTRARFFSERTQRVAEEIQSRNTGLTQNRMLQNQHRSHLEKAQKTEENFDFSDQIQKDLHEMNNNFQSSTPSTTGEKLPNDVKLGSFTALNTDQYLYYTFYARIEQLVRHRWEENLRASVNFLNRRVQSVQINNTQWQSEIEFRLKPDGSFLSAHILKESGISLFDESAVKAFRAARVFPNPPQELVQEDGLIHLKFAFNVYYQHPKAIARPQSNSN